MNATSTDLDRAFRGNGTEFEAFVNDLVRASARACGISPHDIDWDSRTSVRDGGRDIVIRVGNPQGPGQLIPARPSLWSLKSGADGIDPKKLRKEILPQNKKDHPKVREALAAGQSFVWCAVHPATSDARDKMRNAAGGIARELGSNDDQIEFRWLDGLAEEANRFPNVIAAHLPDVNRRWAGVRTLREWRAEYGLDTPWAEFGGREGLRDQVARHLLGRGTPHVLHIAGLSGIGKTRTVLEACQRDPQLQGAFYLPHAADVTPGLMRALRDVLGAVIVIDETPLEEVEAVAARFSDCPDTVRVVTIGPASRQRSVYRRDVIVVPEPETEEDILAVIRGPGRGLADEVLKSIAARSAHDLRLALMLVKASLSEPELRTIPIVDFTGVWNRLMRLFPSEIPDPTAYRQAYESLTVAVDVGLEGELRSELMGLADHFGQPERGLLDCLNVAVNCGLGLRAGRFFEATPHALATGLFLSLFRRQLRDRLPDFIAQLPPRLLRRFLERCQECPSDVREEVAAAVGGVFLTWLGGTGLTALVEREPSRVFQAWAEFDPVRGLAWLRRATEAATPEQIRTLDGETDGSGGWRGRRQLVWLCQHLACFAEFFADCEAVLFRLALHETEHRVGNNSTATWQSLFWPVLAQTEVPFYERLPILVHRLRGATPDELPVVLEATLEAISPRLVGLPLIPRVVGGRIVPAPWSPTTHEHWRQLREMAAGELLELVSTFSGGKREESLRRIILRLPLLRDLGLTQRVRTLCHAAPLTPEGRRELVVELDREIGFHLKIKRDDGTPVHSLLSLLQEWKAELASADLVTRVEDLTARDYADVWSQEEGDRPYEGMADELIASPEGFRTLSTWFGTPAAKGAGALAFSLGRRDTADRLAPTIRDWLGTDRCRTVTVGYLNGVAGRGSGLPTAWVAELDALTAANPELAVVITSTADIGHRGFDRIFRVVDRLPAPVSRFLRLFGYGGWHRVLTTSQQGRVLEELVRLAEAGDQSAPGVGVTLLPFWWHSRAEPLHDRFVPPAFRLAEMAARTADRESGYHWRETLTLLCPHDPARVAEAVVAVLTGQSSLWKYDEENIRVLVQAAALAPGQVMEVVGSAIHDPSRRSMFAVGVYRGLFEAVGVDAVRDWVDSHGRQYLRWLARHFGSPSLDPTGAVVIPPLTRWLFTERENDQEAFEWFLAGRRDGAIIGSGERSQDKRREMEPYLNHTLRRVREWALAEVRSAERDDEFFRQWDDEIERL
jgi:hypothetical protein